MMNMVWRNKSTHWSPYSPGVNVNYINDGVNDDVNDDDDVEEEVHKWALLVSYTPEPPSLLTTNNLLQMLSPFPFPHR